MGSYLEYQIQFAVLDREQTVRVLPLTVLYMNEKLTSSIGCTVIVSSTSLTISIEISRSTRDERVSQKEGVPVPINRGKGRRGSPSTLNS